MIEEKDILLTDGEDDPVFEGIYIKTENQKQEILSNQEIVKRLDEVLPKIRDMFYYFAQNLSENETERFEKLLEEIKEGKK